MSEPQPTDSKFVIDVRKFVETAMNDGLRIQAIMLSQKNYEQLIELGLKLRPDLGQNQHILSRFISTAKTDTPWKS